MFEKLKSMWDIIRADGFILSTQRGMNHNLDEEYESVMDFYSKKEYPKREFLNLMDNIQEEMEKT